MLSDDTRLRLQQAAFFDAHRVLMAAFETSGLADILRTEAWGRDWHIHNEDSPTAKVSFGYFTRHGLSVLRFDMEWPDLPALSFSGDTATFGDAKPQKALSQEQFRALLKAFLAECRSIFQRHGLELPPEMEKFCNNAYKNDPRLK